MTRGGGKKVGRGDYHLRLEGHDDAKTRKGGKAGIL